MNAKGLEGDLLVLLRLKVESDGRRDDERAVHDIDFLQLREIDFSESVEAGVNGSRRKVGIQEEGQLRRLLPLVLGLLVQIVRTR